MLKLTKAMKPHPTGLTQSEPDKCEKENTGGILASVNTNLRKESLVMLVL